MKKQLPYIAIIVVILQVCLAAEQQKSNSAIQRQGKSSATSSHHVSSKGDTFIDDDELNGSGHHGGDIHEDLEKEIENSGSGFGPDDEDLAISPRVNKPQYTPPKYSTDHTDHNIKKGESSSTPHFDEEGSGDGGPHFDEDDEDEDDSDNDGDGDGDGINEEKNNAPTIGTGDDFTTEVKQTEVDPSTIKEDDDTKEDDEDDEEEEEEDDELEVDQDGVERRIYEGTNVNAELPRHGPHDDIDQTTNKEITTDKSDANDNTDDNDKKKIEGERKDVISTHNNDVSISGTRDEAISGTASFFAQPGILAAVIGGAVVGLLCAILVVMFIVYRMRKKDEGSYALEEPKRAPVSYAKGANNHEFFA